MNGHVAKRLNQENGNVPIDVKAREQVLILD